jgi:hypothetical protein
MPEGILEALEMEILMMEEILEEGILILEEIFKIQVFGNNVKFEAIGFRKWMLFLNLGFTRI